MKYAMLLVLFFSCSALASHHKGHHHGGHKSRRHEIPRYKDGARCMHDGHWIKGCK